MDAITVRLKRPTPKQREILADRSKRIAVMAGRRGGKTVLASLLATRAFLSGDRVMYAAPTASQSQKFWFEVNKALNPLLLNKIIIKNVSERYFEVPGTEQRLRAKTAWDPDTLRGDYCSLLIMDEFQMMKSTAWTEVGAPMLADTDGRALFIFTKPSFSTIERARGVDPNYAVQMWRGYKEDRSGRCKAYHFTSLDNPHISRKSLEEIAADMTAISYRMEILAEDIDEVPGSLWTRDLIERNRVTRHPNMEYRVVAIDPSASSHGDEAGIIVAGLGVDGLAYVIADVSLQGSPQRWASAAVAAYHSFGCTKMIAESNQGGEMINSTISTIPGAPTVRTIPASEGKYARAEPIAALTEAGRVKFVGQFKKLEDELCTWRLGASRSPNRLDAFVHAITEIKPRMARARPDYSKGGIRHVS